MILRIVCFSILTLRNYRPVRLAVTRMTVGDERSTFRLINACSMLLCSFAGKNVKSKHPQGSHWSNSENRKLGKNYFLTLKALFFVNLWKLVARLYRIKRFNVRFYKKCNWSFCFLRWSCEIANRVISRYMRFIWKFFTLPRLVLANKRRRSHPRVGEFQIFV